MRCNIRRKVKQTNMGLQVRALCLLCFLWNLNLFEMALIWRIFGLSLHTVTKNKSVSSIWNVSVSFFNDEIVADIASLSSWNFYTLALSMNTKFCVKSISEDFKHLQAIIFNVQKQTCINIIFARVPAYVRENKEEEKQ